MKTAIDLWFQGMSFCDSGTSFRKWSNKERIRGSWKAVPVMEAIRVLLVDDEETFRSTAATTLRKRGFTVKTVGRGFDAVKEIWRDDYDVVVLDLKMPGMDGHETLRRIKGLKHDVGVIMLTGHGTLDSALEGWRDEVFTYLTKPCDIDTLVQAIYGAFKRKKSDDDRESSAMLLRSATACNGDRADTPLAQVAESGIPKRRNRKWRRRKSAR